MSTDKAKENQAQENQAKEFQQEGTREFEEAIAGKGPAMPPDTPKTPEEKELEKALEDTFPASDPIQVTSPDSRVGAPKGRQSSE